VPALDHVGVRAGLSAIYLGNGVVLTANHVGAGDVDFAGYGLPLRARHRGPARESGRHLRRSADVRDLPAADLPDLAIVATRPAYLALLWSRATDSTAGGALVGSQRPSPPG
jgi:hypothetical protein